MGSYNNYLFNFVNSRVIYLGLGLSGFRKYELIIWIGGLDVYVI